MMRIRDPLPGDEAAWRALWSGYNAFYEAVVPEEVTAATWRRILDPVSPVFARLAEQDGCVTGFAVCVLHPGTWSLAPLCYLEDLFVDPARRRTGAGEAMIRDLLDLGRSCGWSRVYWHTRADNAAARRLYDRFAAADGFVRYTLALP